MKPVVFLHGFTGVPTSFDSIAEGISQAAPVIAPALLGHAGGPQLGTSFSDEVDRLAALIANKSRAPAVVVGYSLGARLALGLAARQPATVSDLILISVNPGLRSDQQRRARVADDELLASFLEQHGTRAFIEQRWATQPLFASQQALPETVLATQAAQRLQHDAAGLAHCLRILGLGAMPSYWEALPAISARTATTVLTGTLDQKFHGLAAEVCALNSKIAWLSAPNVGHNLVLEAPELVARMVQHAQQTPPPVRQ